MPLPKLLNDQCQINGHDLGSFVSARISYWCQQGYKLSYQYQHGHKLLIDQCQTNVYNLLSYQYQSEACNDQCQTKGLDLNLDVSMRTSYQSQQRHKFLIYQFQTKMQKFSENNFHKLKKEGNGPNSLLGLFPFWGASIARTLKTFHCFHHLRISSVYRPLKVQGPQFSCNLVKMRGPFANFLTNWGLLRSHFSVKGSKILFSPNSPLPRLGLCLRYRGFGKLEVLISSFSPKVKLDLQASVHLVLVYSQDTPSYNHCMMSWRLMKTPGPAFCFSPLGANRIRKG